MSEFNETTNEAVDPTEPDQEELIILEQNALVSVLEGTIQDYNSLMEKVEPKNNRRYEVKIEFKKASKIITTDGEDKRVGILTLVLFNVLNPTIRKTLLTLKNPLVKHGGVLSDYTTTDQAICMIELMRKFLRETFGTYALLSERMIEQKEAGNATDDNN